MWSCFEDLDARNMMLQSEFNLDIPSETMFASEWCHCFVLSACIDIFFLSLHANGHIYWTKMRSTTYTTGSSGDGGRYIALIDVQPHPPASPSFTSAPLFAICQTSSFKLCFLFPQLVVYYYRGKLSAAYVTPRWSCMRVGAARSTRRPSRVLGASPPFLYYE